MGVSKKAAQEQGQKAIERPNAAMRVSLRRGRTGVTLLYGGRAVARLGATAADRRLAPYLAAALGVRLPPEGQSAEAVVSSGVMFRVLSIASLDLANEESLILLDYLLQEANEMRGYQSAEA
jgi:hypothetical protein